MRLTLSIKSEEGLWFRMKKNVPRGKFANVKLLIPLRESKLPLWNYPVIRAIPLVWW